MNIIRKLPGPFLIFLGALSLSFGGLIVKSFEGATLWQILFWRSLFFSLTVLAFLIFTYKKKNIRVILYIWPTWVFWRCSTFFWFLWLRFCYV